MLQSLLCFRAETSSKNMHNASYREMVLENVDVCSCVPTHILPKRFDTRFIQRISNKLITLLNSIHVSCYELFKTTKDDGVDMLDLHIWLGQNWAVM